MASKELVDWLVLKLFKPGDDEVLRVYATQRVTMALESGPPMVPRRRVVEAIEGVQAEHDGSAVRYKHGYRHAIKWMEAILDDPDL